MRACVAIALLLSATTSPTWPQTSVPFGGVEHDSSLPVEIAADTLKVSQTDGNAVFTGNVRVGQGELKMKADQLTVVYGTGNNSGQVTRMEAFGNVLLSNGAEAAESEQAVYDVDTGAVVMEGAVLLTQGPNALSGDTLRIDLNAGDAQMEGRVRTVLQPKQANQ